LGGGSARRKDSAYTQNDTRTEKTHTQASMPEFGFEPTIPVFEQAKAVHALDRAATLTGSNFELTL
jgi:hypothetical protein